MEFVNFSNLNKEEQQLVADAFEAAEHSIPHNDHKVGCAILDTVGNVYVGATNTRSRVIGSTCAERMAMDQLCFQKKIPKLCVLVGKFLREKWRDDFVCTPCGVCLEMFFETMQNLNLQDIPFICLSWDKSRVLKINLSELYPQIGKNFERD